MSFALTDGEAKDQAMKHRNALRRQIARIEVTTRYPDQLLAGAREWASSELQRLEAELRELGGGSGAARQ